MRPNEQLLEEEEQIRKKVRKLPDEKKVAFFKAVEQRLKDPDTYAALNFLFIAGLHHYYLGKWLRGSVNIVVFLVGVVMLFSPLILAGIVLIVAISIVELYALFKSQDIVLAHNIKLMEQIYREIC